MGYVVRHSTSNVNKTRRRGKVAIGTDSRGYDKTSSSGLYNGVPPVEGKHNFVKVAQGGDPNFYNLTDQELINFVNGLGERNLTTTTPSQTGWAGSYSLIDNDTRTFRLTTQQNNAATTSAWRTWYWDVSDYEGQTVAISADVEFVSETNCTFLSMTIGQGNTGQYTLHIAGSDAADRVTINTKPTNSIRMEWSGSINATGIVGFTQWINNVTTNGANSIIEVSNVQIEVNDHVTDFSNPDSIVYTALEAQNYLLDRDDIIFTDDVKNDNAVTDGLILHLDPSSKSSFLDNEPITNLVANPLLTGDNPTSGWGNYGFGDNNFFKVTNIRSAVGEGKAFEVIKNTSSNGTVVKTHSSTALSTGDKVTVSFYVKGVGDTIGNNVHIHTYANSTDGSVSTGTTYSGELEGGWKKFTHTYTWTKSVDSYATVYSYCRVNFGTGGIFLVSNPQVVYGDKPKNFISGSRSQNTTWKDISGNGNDVTLENGVTFNEKGWFDFDGADDIATGPNINPSAITVEIWKKWTTLSDDWLITNQPTSVTGNSYGWYFRINSPGYQIYWRVGKGGSGISLTDYITLNEWYHVVGTFDTNGSAMYLNGEQVQTGTGGTIDYTGVQGLTIGSANDNSRDTPGPIGSVKIYNKALSQEEVSQNYYGGDIVTNGLTFAVDAGNLVSYEEDSTTAYSMTGSIEGTLINGTTYTGSNGGTWTFDNSDDKITFPNNTAFNHTSELTIESWVRFDGNSQDFIFEKGNVNTQYSLFSHGTDIVFRTYHAGDGGYDTQNPSKTSVGIVNGQWHHIVGSWDGSTKRIYIDGVEKNSKSKSGALTTTSQGAAIGAFGGTSSGYYFGGDIAIVRIYNQGLSKSEVLQNYNAQKARFT